MVTKEDLISYIDDTIRKSVLIDNIVKGLPDKIDFRKSLVIKIGFKKNKD